MPLKFSNVMKTHLYSWSVDIFRLEVSLEVLIIQALKNAFPIVNDVPSGGQQTAPSQKIGHPDDWLVLNSEAALRHSEHKTI